MHQIGDVFTTLTRSNFAVDALLEPEPVDGVSGIHTSTLVEWVPPTLVVRARKLGI